MKPRKQKRNKHLYIWLAVICLAVGCFFAPAPAHAYNFTAPALTGSQICPGATGLTRRLIPCIKENFLNATNQFLVPFSQFLGNTVSAACVLSLILLGVKLVSGSDTAPLKESMVTIMKIGFVTTFTYNFGGNTLDPNNTHGGNFGMVLDIMDDLLNFAAGYVINASEFGINSNICPEFNETVQSYYVWDTIDCALQTLVGGVFSDASITTGIIGFLTACLFSNALGFTIGITGVYLIYKLIFAVIKCVYIFLSAYMGISFMVIISPLFIPTLLFKSTKSYFDRWLKLFTSFLIQPMMVFAYLAMLLAAFDETVYSGDNSVYNIITNGYYKNGAGVMDIGEWLNTKEGMYTTEEKDAEAITINNKTIKDFGMVPTHAETGGAEGKVATATVDFIEEAQSGLMQTLGVGGIDPNFLEIAIIEQTIDWTHLAIANDYNGTATNNPATNTASYMMTLLLAFGMALVTAHIFFDMLDAIPLIGSGMANYGKPGESLRTSLAGKSEAGGGGEGPSGKMGM